MNLQEIFIWYFEQKGVDNPERFLGANEGVNTGVNAGGDEVQPVSVNQAGSVDNLDALNPTQPQANDMNPTQENQTPVSEELSPEQSAEPQSQGLNAEALMKLIPVISKLKQSGKGSFSKILSSVLNQ